MWLPHPAFSPFNRNRCAVSEARWCARQANNHDLLIERRRDVTVSVHSRSGPRHATLRCGQNQIQSDRVRRQRNLRAFAWPPRSRPFKRATYAPDRTLNRDPRNIWCDRRRHEHRRLGSAHQIAGTPPYAAHHPSRTERLPRSQYAPAPLPLMLAIAHGDRAIDHHVADANGVQKRIREGRRIGIVGTRFACRAPTEIVPGVSLAIDQVAPRADRRSIFSAFTVSIASSGSVWIPACGGVIRPDVAVMIRGQRVDTDSGSLCTADRTTGPAPIAPGTRYTGQSTVQTAANARFVPHVVVGLTRSLGAPVRHVVGTPFEAE